MTTQTDERVLQALAKIPGAGPDGLGTSTGILAANLWPERWNAADARRRQLLRATASRLVSRLVDAGLVEPAYYGFRLAARKDNT